MSEQNLPTLNQLESEISKCLTSIGILDAEFRKVAGPYQELAQRLEQIEKEKVEKHRLLANLEYTKEVVEKGEEDKSSEPEQDSSED